MAGQHKNNRDAKNGRYALSVDVEDYFQVWAFSGVIARSSWDGFALRAGDATRRCLDLFDEHGAKATFFTLGWIAERDPALVREIVARGHELASHGYDHAKVNQQTRTEFIDDVIKTKRLLEDIASVQVKGYRAAGFSIDETTPWAYDILAETGHLYSSSSHPIAHDHYGDDKAPRTPHHPKEDSPLIEAPVATVEYFGKRLSCAGGGWFRATPRALSTCLLKRAGKTLAGPVIFYFHPWEVDPDQPRIKSAPLKSRFRHYLNLDRMQAKLSKTLKAFHWGRIDDALGIGAAS